MGFWEFMYKAFAGEIESDISSKRTIHHSKPKNEDAMKRIEQLIEENKDNVVEIGDIVRYLVSADDIEGGSNPQRPTFDRAIVMETNSDGMFRIEQNKKSIWTLPALLEGVEK